jgi:hypothetical protein
VAGMAAVCVACAPAALAAAAVNPRVTPTTGHPHTTFRVSFTAPQAAGHQGVTERSYSVELSVRGQGCSQAAAQTVPNAAAGQRVHLQFRPSQRWCLGKGRGTVSMTEGPYCNPPDPCPEFPTRTSDIGHFSFKVVRR